MFQMSEVVGDSASRGLKTEWKNLFRMSAMHILSVVKAPSVRRKLTD